MRNSWGTYFGQLGFFLLERGTNALLIENGDCWWAAPSWEDEQDVRSGAKVGTMWGIMTPEEAAEVLPEPATKPRHRDDPPATAATATDDVDIEALGVRNPWATATAAPLKTQAAGDAVLSASSGDAAAVNAVA